MSDLTSGKVPVISDLSNSLPSPLDAVPSGNTVNPPAHSPGNNTSGFESDERPCRPGTIAAPASPDPCSLLDSV